MLMLLIDGAWRELPLLQAGHRTHVGGSSQSQRRQVGAPAESRSGLLGLRWDGIILILLVE